MGSGGKRVWVVKLANDVTYKRCVGWLLFSSSSSFLFYMFMFVCDGLEKRMVD